MQWFASSNRSLCIPALPRPLRTGYTKMKEDETKWERERETGWGSEGKRTIAEPQSHVF